MKYKKLLNKIKHLLKDNETFKVCESFAQKFILNAKEVAEKTGPIDYDLPKIVGLIQGLLFLKKKKTSRKKKVLYSLIIASLLILIAVVAVKVYEKDGTEPEEKIRNLIKKLDVDSITKNGFIKKIKKKIRESIE